MEATVAPKEFAQLLFNFAICHTINFDCVFGYMSWLSKSILGDYAGAGSAKASLVDQFLSLFCDERSKLTVCARSSSSRRELIRLLFPARMRLVNNTKSFSCYIPTPESPTMPIVHTEGASNCRSSFAVSIMLKTCESRSCANSQVLSVSAMRRATDFPF